MARTRSWISLIALAAALTGCDWSVSPDERIERAQEYIEVGNDRGALIELQNAVRSDPNLARARVMLTEISLRLGDIRGAEKELEALRHSGAATHDVDRLAARIDLAAGRHKALLDRIEAQDFGVEEPERSALQGSALRRSERYEEALAAFDRSLQANPEFADARTGRADVLISLSRSDEALVELDKALEKNERHAGALLMKGSVLASRGDYKHAIEMLTRARRAAAGQLSTTQVLYVLSALTASHLAIQELADARATHAELVKFSPDAPITRLLAARIALASQDFSTAVAESQLAVTSAPQFTQAKLVLGSALIAAGRINQAEAVISELVRDSPENAEARKLLAQINLQLQRPDVAMQVLSKVPPAQAQDPQVDMLLGRAHLQLGDQASAINVLEKGAAAQPNDLRVRTELAMAYLQAGQPQRAVDVLQEDDANRRDPQRDAILVAALAATKGEAVALQKIDSIAATASDVEVNTAVAQLYVQFGKPDRARRVLERVLDQSPENLEVLLQLAAVEFGAKDIVAARNVLHRAAKLDPANNKVRVGIAQTHVAEGNIPDAIQLLEQVRKSDPREVAARLALGRLYLKQQNQVEADKVNDELVSAADGSAAVRLAIGRAYSGAGLYDKALARFREAATEDPTNADPLIEIARTQIALGNRSAARESTQKALAIQPASSAANVLAITFDAQDGRLSEANERLATLKKAHPGDPTYLLLEGDVAMTAKSYAAASGAYEQAWKIAPSSAAAVRRHRARLASGSSGALEPLEEWLARQPNDLGVRMLLAEAYMSTNQSARAIVQYETLSRAAQPSPMALNNLAWLYHIQGDSRALDTAARAYELAPQSADIADTYGWILVQAGRVSEGLPVLEKAAATANSQPDIQYHYAFALARSGQKDAARQKLQELARKNVKFSSESEVKALLQELGS